MPPLFDFGGRRVIVYGVDAPLGKAIAAAMRAAGATVAMTSSSTDGNALLAMKRAAAGGPAEAVDLSNVTNVQVATKKLQKALGGLDVAVAVIDAARHPAALPDVFRSASREIARKGEDGRLLAVLSESDALSESNATALPALLQSLERASGSTVNVVLVRSLGAAAGAEVSAGDPVLRAIPIQSAATPDDVAQLALYLCSAAGAGIDGQVLTVEGGALGRLDTRIDANIDGGTQ